MNEFIIVPTGSIIKDYLDSRSISQKDLAKRTGMSEKHISNVLSGNARLTEEFALKLEKIMPDVNASYWLNYEAKYREYIARNVEKRHISEENLEEIAKRFLFSSYFDEDLPIVDEAIEMLKLLKINSFDNFQEVYSSKNIYYMENKATIEEIAIWLNLCENEIGITNKELATFNLKKFVNNLGKIKSILSIKDIVLLISEIRVFLNTNNVYFVYADSTFKSNIRGALSSYRGNPAIYISAMINEPSEIAFALMHEIGHLCLHYVKNKTFISNDNENNAMEKEADKFANDFLGK